MTVAKRRMTDYQQMNMDVEQSFDENTRQFVSFNIDDQYFCIDIMAVREIKAWIPTTTLPNSPSHVLGVINLRGSIVPVIDLRLRFGGLASKPTPTSVIIIVAIGAAHTGLLVDGVSDILSTRKDDISPIPELDGEKRNPYFAGLLNMQDRLVAIVSLENLLLRLENHAAVALNSN